MCSFTELHRMGGVGVSGLFCQLNRLYNFLGGSLGYSREGSWLD